MHSPHMLYDPFTNVAHEWSANLAQIFSDDVRNWDIFILVHQTNVPPKENVSFLQRSYIKSNTFINSSESESWWVGLKSKWNCSSDQLKVTERMRHKIKEWVQHIYLYNFWMLSFCHVLTRHSIGERFWPLQMILLEWVYELRGAKSTLKRTIHLKMN